MRSRYKSSLGNVPVHDVSFHRKSTAVASKLNIQLHFAFLFWRKSHIMPEFLVLFPIAKSKFLHFAEHHRVIELYRRQLDAPRPHLPEAVDGYIQNKGQQ